MTQMTGVKVLVNYYVDIVKNSNDVQYLDDLFNDFPSWDNAREAPKEKYVIMHAVNILSRPPSQRMKYYIQIILHEKTKVNISDINADIDFNDIDSIINNLQQFSREHFLIIGV